MLLADTFTWTTGSILTLFVGAICHLYTRLWNEAKAREKASKVRDARLASAEKKLSAMIAVIRVLRNGCPAHTCPFTREFKYLDTVFEQADDAAANEDNPEGGDNGTVK